MSLSIKQLKRKSRHRRVRGLISGTADRPRLSVFRSNEGIFAQLIDDTTQKTLLGLGSGSVSLKKKMTKLQKSFEFGKLFGKRALESGVKRALFDRGGYLFHGRVKAFAEGVKESGLNL